MNAGNYFVTQNLWNGLGHNTVTYTSDAIHNRMFDCYAEIGGYPARWNALVNFLGLSWDTRNIEINFIKVYPITSSVHESHPRLEVYQPHVYNINQQLIGIARPSSKL